LQAKVTLGAGEEVEVVILLGEADSLPGVRSLIREVDATKAFAETRAFWDSMASTIQVRTPSTAANVMLNGWLVYQTLSCRFWGRSALYQSGGAFGFRDQLQDVLALIYASPNLVREHILRAAARQFVEGDVQHWWHPDTGNGVRTRCSDDLVWLAYAVAQYVAITGDRSILEERVAFLEGPALGPGESERMFVPSIAERTGTVYEHCQLALERAWQLGRHGLPLMGSGDWNDGMNRVGVEGRGESVWLAWFLGATLDSFAGVIEDRDSRFAELCRERARAAALAVENAAWDGEWYLRAYFDDGSTLGSRENEEARIDSIAQSWAVISGLGDHERARVAMDSAERILVDERARIIELFTPPFDHSLPHPGYIMGYPPGVRENGGQYTHAALWVAMARARMGDGDSAVRLLTMLNPIEHTSNAEGVVRYGAEPYVIAADVSAAPGRTGRAGWTWYTGSAGWMYRIWIEEVLGFKRRGDELRIEPAIPEDWPGFTLTYRYGSTTYEIEVDRAAGSGNVIRLVDDGGRHSVRVGVRVAPKREARPAAGYSLTETSENGVHEVVPLLTKKG
jgi:cyclic beta-1,2-glucan synthetase